MAKNLWKPGQSGNPAGKPKAPPEVHLGREITQTEIKGIFSRLLRMSLAELTIFLKDVNKPAHDLVVARIIAEAIRKGDPARLDFLYNRLVGKARDPSAEAVAGSLNHMIVQAMQKMQERDVTEQPALPEPANDGDPE